MKRILLLSVTLFSFLIITEGCINSNINGKDGIPPNTVDICILKKMHYEQEKNNLKYEYENGLITITQYNSSLDELFQEYLDENPCISFGVGPAPAVTEIQQCCDTRDDDCITNCNVSEIKVEIHLVTPIEIESFVVFNTDNEKEPIEVGSIEKSGTTKLKNGFKLYKIKIDPKKSFRRADIQFKEKNNPTIYNVKTVRKL